MHMQTAAESLLNGALHLFIHPFNSFITTHTLQGWQHGMTRPRRQTLHMHTAAQSLLELIVWYSNIAPAVCRLDQLINCDYLTLDAI